ncbi:MAG: hypothetical protein AB1467_05780 [Candidatus Diapherotrites archaeon]
MDKSKIDELIRKAGYEIKVDKIPEGYTPGIIIRIQKGKTHAFIDIHIENNKAYFGKLHIGNVEKGVWHKPGHISAAKAIDLMLYTTERELKKERVKIIQGWPGPQLERLLRRRGYNLKKQEYYGFDIKKRIGRKNPLPLILQSKVKKAIKKI